MVGLEYIEMDIYFQYWKYSNNPDKIYKTFMRIKTSDFNFEIIKNKLKEHLFCKDEREIIKISLYF